MLPKNVKDSIRTLSSYLQVDPLDLMEMVIGLRSGTPAGTAKPKARAKTGTDSGNTVNVNTAEGRKKYRKAVLDAVKGASGSIPAGEVRARAGGTPNQVRTALNRLIEEGELTFEGKKRGTKYSAA